jgi:hypothetical protein
MGKKNFVFFAPLRENKNKKMKTKLRTYVLVLATLVVLQACCSKEYIIGDIQRSFSFIDVNTNKDLVFGNDKIWKKDSLLIRYSSLNNYSKISNFLYSKYQDSAVVINFDNNDTCFIKFPNNDVDTILIMYQEQSTKSAGGTCKMRYNVIESLKYNNVSVDINNEPIKIYKN